VKRSVECYVLYAMHQNIKQKYTDRKVAFESLEVVYKMLVELTQGSSDIYPDDICESKSGETEKIESSKVQVLSRSKRNLLTLIQLRQ